MAREIVKKLSHVTENHIICQNSQQIMGLIFNDEKTLLLFQRMMNSLQKKPSLTYELRKTSIRFNYSFFSSSVE